MKDLDLQLVTILAECAVACNYCSAACLKEKNVEEMVQCIRLDLDCAQICGLTAAFISRRSDHARRLIKECAEICGKCADECGKHAEMDHCKKCALACRKCKEACDRG